MLAIRALILLLAGAAPVAALSAEPADPPALEQARHRCLREAYGHRPAGQSRAGDERNALDECKPHEDAYVAALTAARPEDADRPVLAWARTWMAYAVDPVKAWIEALRR